MIDTKNRSTVYVVMYKLITYIFGLEQEDGSFDYSHGACTSPSH